MASTHRQSSSGSDGDPRYGAVDERKRKRMESNRESARRSRMRKQKQMEDLTGEMSRLQLASNQLLQSINAKEQAYFQVESANNVLRAQEMELTDRLRSLNLFLHTVEDVSGLSMDIPEMPDPMIPDPMLKLNPWQFQQPIMASADMFLV